MEITEVRISLRDEERLKAFANLTFDNAFVICGLKVIGGQDAYVVAMPSRRRSNGRHQDRPTPSTGSCGSTSKQRFWMPAVPRKRDRSDPPRRRRPESPPMGSEAA